MNTFKQKTPPVINPLTDEALDKVIAVLETVGLTLDYGFEYHVQKQESYLHFGSLEWSERGYGSRFYFSMGRAGRLDSIKVVNLDRAVISKGRLVEVNAELAEIVEKFNI